MIFVYTVAFVLASLCCVSDDLVSRKEMKFDGITVGNSRLFSI